MSGAPTSSPLPSSAAVTDARQRLRQEMQQAATHRHVQAANSILVFIVLDALILAGFAWAGELGLSTSLCFLAAGATLIGGYRLAIHRGLHLAGSGVPIALATTAAMSSLMLGTACLSPQVGVLMLLTLVTMIAMTALSLPARYTLTLCVLLGLCAVGLMHLHGAAFTLPRHNLAEQALSGVWFTLVLVRGAALNLRGIELRKALAVKGEELADALQRLEQLATHDELTGLLNRRAAMSLLARVADGDRTFSIALFDIDGFKKVNDTLGHATGDTVLQQFAGAMQSAVRDTDGFARYGGEEFLLVMPRQRDAAGAVRVADRLRATVQAHDWRRIEASLAVTVSAGVATREPGETLEQLLARADGALYRAKREGRNCVRSA